MLSNGFQIYNFAAFNVYLVAIPTIGKFNLRIYTINISGTTFNEETIGTSGSTNTE